MPSLLPGTNRFVPPDPPNQPYTPGIGRGATAFTTRADLGIESVHTRASAEKQDPFGKPPIGYVPGRGRGATGFSGGVSRDDTSSDERDRGDYSDGNFDEFSGYAESLFKDMEYDEEDREADTIYEHIDSRMDDRRKSRREKKLKTEISQLRASRPTIEQQFADVKRALSTVTPEEWEAIPSIGDYSLKYKQKKARTLMPAPDSLLAESREYMQSASRVQPGISTPIGFGSATPLGTRTPIYGMYSMGIQTPLGLQTPLGIKTPLGLMTPLGGNGSSLNDLGEARGTVLTVKLDKVMDSLTGQTVIDPKGYLTDLNSMQVQSATDIADIQKVRTLLKSVTTTNPKHPPGWIAAARLEELAGKINVAREVIEKGCTYCPKSEDIWVEAARLEKPVYAKTVLARAVKHLPHSVRLWLESYNREHDKEKKALILKKALEFIPNSVRLWKEAVSLENENNARILLTRAVECIPSSVELWLALARLSNYTEAQKVLNEARKRIPTSPEIWVSAAKLEETHENFKKVEAIISRSIENLSAKGVAHDRETWLKLAEDAETSGYVQTCRAIIKATIKIGVDEMGCTRTWKEDAEGALSRGCLQTARSIYIQALVFVNTKKSLWLKLADLETKHGTPQSLDAVLQKAVSYCPNAEVLWLMAAKQKWLHGDVPTARRILAEAFSHNVNAEAISLAAVKLERETKEYGRAKALLAKARIQVNTPKVWMQSIQLERLLGNYTEAVELSNESIKLFPNFAKFWMIYGQLCLEKDPPDMEEAADIFSRGLNVCGNSAALWLCAVDCQKSAKNWIRGRAILEKARLRVPHNEVIWHASVMLEIESGSPKMANFLMSKAMQDCPTSGLLWALAIELEPRTGQNAKSVDALNKCENDAHVVLAVSKIFWKDGKDFKARKWFNRSVSLNPNFGDAWGGFMACEIDRGTEETQKEVLRRFLKAECNTGIMWNRISKKMCNYELSLPEKLMKLVIAVYPDVVTKKPYPPYLLQVPEEPTKTCNENNLSLKSEETAKKEHIPNSTEPCSNGIKENEKENEPPASGSSE